MSISYQITAMVIRYILVLLALIVLIRVITLANGKRADVDQNIGILRSLSREAVYPLFHDSTIGKSGKCDIQIRNKTMDSLHARFYVKKNKCYLLVAIGGNTLVNGVEVIDKIDIQDGDILTMGDEEFLVELSGGAK